MKMVKMGGLIYQLTNPQIKDKIWAGDRLDKQMRKRGKIGELWLISAIRGSESLVDGSYPLSLFYQEVPEFFCNYPKKTYPNLHKIIDAGQPLSLQVHPDDQYAKKKYNSLGKNEAWFVITRGRKPFLIGAKSLDFIEHMNKITNENINDYVNSYALQKGDLAFIPAGTIHSIPEKSLVYEIQQTSDITFRIYDFDRVDKYGKKRKLHLQEAKKAIKPELKPVIVKKDRGVARQLLLKNEHFHLTRIEVDLEYILLPKEDVYWYEVVILEGIGIMAGTKFKKFDAFIISGHLKKPILFIAMNAVILINEVR
ncbi:type I phosphomannose isomerase catalytic subunit [Mesomycoplasma hyopneumoniae]|uniref:type I phosphomannose isomerase catalytic subunit n=1 Tax=Mesomycoplasma hyopneumoniae TaxID=2099 RepID=UPI0015C6827A|nr:type I phosphomannose isomerase catalytic subunit [Mesomycoplasma hyopneumoniae]QLG43562.1 class I mannose-6-phosphate isomerase [Mesomycoplasma hyopneumoniae]